MSLFSLIIYILKFFIPAFFSVLFRAYGLGYKSKKSLALGLSVFGVYMAVVPAFLILTVGYGQFTHLSTVVMTVASMSVLIFTTDGVGKTIFLQLTQGCLTTVLSVILNLIRTVCALSYPILVLMLAIVCPVVYFIALRYWAKPLRFMADHIHAELSAMVALPVIVMVVVYFLPVYPAQNFANHPIFVTGMMLAVECGYLLYIYTFYQNLLEMSELAKAEIKSRLLETEITSYQEYLQAARQSRHDIRHHNAVLLEYLEDGDTQQAIAYLNASDAQLAGTALKQFCENVIANAILRIYDRRTQAMGISFLTQADIPEVLPLAAPEIGALLSNLLENALEACAKQQTGQRYISLTGQQAETGFQLEVRNSTAGELTFENGFPKSAKQGGGTGTKSIAAIVENHHGLLRFKQEEGAFVVQILFPREAK